MKKFLLGLLLLTFTFTLTFTCYAAEDAPIQAEQEVSPMLVPFRVWVLPSWDNGSMIAGHYEYFEMLMPREGLSLVSPATMPVIPTP